ncbi:LLM class flavin-dependent oxidoreductase [Phytoactinopolyspora mesophila]|uniref:LLM class flavin-dependent oxidoreductase n=1 Tax=Phytoactinopolyspora mesophila TaxID=2650750 RepID=A0A7K3M0C0_9ACTN|nr:LLM class flavin-dependent oxidoreductase [Phytoactinopolyspora mesophila]NDL56719.1 LLM class flavin-dependent oxidoreductase [Phytoactinopolyspora mesophila]
MNALPARQITLGLQSNKTGVEYQMLGALAEDVGFDGVSVFNDLGFQPPLSALLEIARVTEHIRLGPACLNPFLLHPVEIAGQIAALDLASSGRAYLGLTRGAWLERVGVTGPRPVRALSEAAEITRRLLRGDDTGYTGETFRLAPGMALNYQPVRPDVDLLFGVWGPRGAEEAKASAGEVKLGGTANPDMVRRMRSWLAGSGVGIVAGAVTVVDEDRALARARARSEVAMYLDVVAELDHTVELPADVLTRLPALLAAGRTEDAGRLVPDDLLDRFCFSGTPDDVAEQAARVIEAGASRIEFGTPHGLTDGKGIELLGRKVLPALRRNL